MTEDERAIREGWRERTDKAERALDEVRRQLADRDAEIVRLRQVIEDMKPFADTCFSSASAVLSFINKEHCREEDALSSVSPAEPVKEPRRP